MKIRDIRTTGLQVPLRRVFGGGTYSVASRATIITEILTEEGPTGCMYSGDTREEGQAKVLAAVEELKPLLIGEELLAAERLWEKMFRYAASDTKRQPYLMEAVSALDIALWDAIGKAANLPLYKLWGGYRDSLPIIAIAGYYEEGKDLGRLSREMAWLRAQGMAGVKMKVGRMSVEEDIARLAAARKAAGDDFLIACDANRAWNLRDALRFARAAREYDLLWLEEPLQWNNEIEGMRKVRHATGVAVTAGQSVWSAMQCRDLIDGEAIDYLNVDASYAGGPTEWRKAAAYAALHDVLMAHHEEPQVSMQLLASVPNAGFVECFPNPDRDPLWATLILNRPPIHDGIIELPKGPGFGLEFDPEVIARYRVQ